ncbi:hypothetical protein HRG_002806 [Hirsutella rhossiliensis]|uniref:Uncharacterized protein n=1 Tax=Hirsutella rhossiliensis TaxID=111463 RepID=A0A9P8SKI3_9HYPO|nr:uncharacterized protein HRG_02806 [Hirsutella rhossiliensis]KAH0964790.1 hypothetical protein HRG_02806 [Hirsutella rhossiliensis]
MPRDRHPSLEAQQLEAESAVDQNAQEEARIAESMTLSWSRSSLIIVYICMWLLYFSSALRSLPTANLSPFVLSGLQKHSLLPVIGVVTSVMTGATYIPLAKILSLWDRTAGFSAMAALATLGMVFMAACNTFELYAAAYVFYSLGKRKAKQKDFLSKPKSDRALSQSIQHYVVEFDVVGVFLLCAGFWGTGYIIAMLVIGFFLLIAFGL